MKGMTSDVLIRDRLFDLRHVASDAFIARAIRLVMGMRLNARRMRSRLRVRAVAIQAQRIAGFTHHGDVVPAMRIVARKASDATGVHQALHKIVALHAVLVGGAIGKVGKGGFAEFVFLELPVVCQILAAS